MMNTHSIKKPKTHLTKVNGCSSENTSEVGKNPFTKRDNDRKYYTKDPTAKELKIQPTDAVTQALPLQFKMTLQQIEIYSIPSFLENTGTTKYLFHIF